MASHDWAEKRLREVAPNETIVKIVKCTHGQGNPGYLVATDRCIWWLGKKLLSKEAEEFDYSSPISVSKSLWVGVLTIGSDQFQMKEAVAQEFAHIFHEARSQMAVPVATEMPSVADELGKLADLRDRGVLTADEFEAKKAELM
jgi:Short C-terminal domain